MAAGTTAGVSTGMASTKAAVGVPTSTWGRNVITSPVVQAVTRPAASATAPVSRNARMRPTKMRMDDHP